MRPAIRAAKRSVRESLDARRHHGRAPVSRVPLPPPSLRQGGDHFWDDARFVSSATQEVERIATVTNLVDAGILDLGCGPGRLAVGLLESAVSVRDYLGVEVQARHVAWSRRHITRHDPRFEFLLLDAANERYNPSGGPASRLPVSENSYDLVHAYSVFSHMRSGDLAQYLREAQRVLVPGGFVAATAFVEEGVADEIENPVDYGPLAWSGALHCVRYSIEFFTGLARENGLKLVRFDHGEDTDGQSFVVLRKQQS